MTMGGGFDELLDDGVGIAVPSALEDDDCAAAWSPKLSRAECGTSSLVATRLRPIILARVRA